MTRNERDLTISIVGTSGITRMLAQSVERTPGIRVGGVFSRDAGRARDTAAEVGADWFTDSFDALLARSEIDAVYIASPNSVHGAQARAAIDAGKHVLVEKPAVLSSAEWTELVARADAAGVLILEGMRTEYDPGTALVRSLLPSLGTLTSATLRYQSRSSRYDLMLAGEPVNMFDPALGGGALNDIGVYPLHAMVSLFGMPTELSAVTVRVTTGVEGSGAVLARYPGLAVDVQYSKISTSPLPSEILGDAGTMVIDHIASPRRIEVIANDGTVALHTLDEPQHVLDGEVARFVQALRTGESAAHDQALTRQTLELIEQVRERGVDA